MVTSANRKKIPIKVNLPKYASFIFFFQHIKRVLDSPNFAQTLDGDDRKIGHMFVVGGFAESAILQETIRSEFGYKMNVIIPQVIFLNDKKFTKVCSNLRFSTKKKQKKCQINALKKVYT